MARLVRIVVILLLGGPVPAQGADSLWVTAYYPGWRQKRLGPEQVDFGAITHLAHFAVLPCTDGSLDAAANSLTPENIKATVSAAHGAGRKILLTVGGRATRERFVSAMSDARHAAFIAALVQFMRANGYDGIDIDMEELLADDERDYSRFIRELRKKLDGFNPRPLLTAAAIHQPRIFSGLAGEFDQINLMTYNLSGPYPGWVVWHSGPFYDGGRRFPNSRQKLPSLDGLVEEFLAAGVPTEKLGVGLSFNGYVWSGGEVSRPGQSWTMAPAVNSVPYYELAQRYSMMENGERCPGCRWDDEAQAAYLSIEGGGPTETRFVSYGNEATAAKTVHYARAKGLGGLIIWELGAGYRAEQPPGRRDLLLQAVKRARFGAKRGGR